jgi:hypothetical protein
VTSSGGDYLKAGIVGFGAADDSSGVNVHAAFPVVWVKLGMLLLNLVAWTDAAAQLAR